MAKKSTSSASAKYTEPALRERLKKKIIAADKGGRVGEWSARKAQLLAAEYKKAGGGYVGARKTSQKHLKKWTEEKWHTSDKKPAIRGKATTRYLPDKAWSKLTAAEKRATNAKKKSASKKGTQFVANTKAAKKAGKAARRRKSAKR